tara:strand:- start:2641 stop:3030 length:390 start_codon:yes stop_codon:yes gene_type:complete
MKYLSDYMEEKQTELFKKTGTIFAFSQKQFEEQRKDNVTYVNLGQGMLTEEPNVEEVINELDKIYKDCIKQDIEENGKEKIILRELENHEAFYVSNTEDTERKLEDYECISKEDIKRVYLENYQKYNNY